VVVDCANGAAYKVAPTALYELGAEVIEVGVGPNGFNINEECGSTYPRTMIKAVRDYRADIGLALDGDADRLVICDEKGQLVDGDQIMALIARTWAAQGKLAGGGVVATVMSNLGLERCLGELGLTLERTAVGDRSVMVRMRQGAFNVGGEPSGHIILSDYSTTGDGLIAGLQVLAELVRSKRPMSALAQQFEPVPQKLENVRFAGGKPLDSEAVKSVIAEAQARLNGSGRVLVRASGTEPLIRIMAEGDDEKLVGQLVREIAGAVRTAAAAAA
jgi:phosphoglucosamine mutase